MRRFVGVVIVCGLVLGSSLAWSDDEPSLESFSFGLVGDYPYFPRDDAGFPYLIEDLRRAPDLSWILHLGDLHNPRSTPCEEALFRERRDAFLSTGKPFAITLGDNDWVDCDGDGTRFLEPIRRLFFADPALVLGGSGIEPRFQEREDGVRENLMWVHEGVVFATLHMIAGGLPPQSWFESGASEQAVLREAALAWMKEAFQVAREEDARGVFFATQVSLWVVSGNPELLHVLDPGALEPPGGFEPFLESLHEETRAFGRPVVLANGDTHTFRIDKPLIDETNEVLQNFTRVEGFGSPHGHWVRVFVEPDREEVFSFRQEWVPENLYTLVPREERNDGFEDFTLGRLIYLVRIAQWTPTVLALIGAFVVIRSALRFVAERRARR